METTNVVDALCVILFAVAFFYGKLDRQRS